MAYTIPDMPLLCRVWTGPGAPVGAPRVSDIPCNLGWGRRGLVSALYPSESNYPSAAAQLLVPAGTDIRGYANEINGDWVEVPQGTGRFYYCHQVDDIGKGFDNEHRFALIAPYGAWTTHPYP